MSRRMRKSDAEVHDDMRVNPYKRKSDDYYRNSSRHNEGSSYRSKQQRFNDVKKQSSGSFLLRGLDPVEHADWINKKKAEHDETLRKGWFTTLWMPLVLFKAIGVKIFPFQKEMQVVMRSKGRNYDEYINLTMEEFAIFQKQYPVIRKFNQKVLNNEEIHGNVKPMKTREGWFYKEGDLSDNLRITFVWHPEIEHSTVELSKPEGSIKLSVGGLLYFIDHGAEIFDALLNVGRAYLGIDNRLLKACLFKNTPEPYYAQVEGLQNQYNDDDEETQDAEYE